jgi:hypothetical protein
MEKRIAASWCLPESNARIVGDVPDCMIFPRRKFRQTVGTQNAARFPARRFVIASEATQSRARGSDWIVSSLRFLAKTRR